VFLVRAGGRLRRRGGWLAMGAASMCRDLVLILVFTCNNPVKTVLGGNSQQEANIPQVILIPMLA
jgi:hypothetical protein